MKRWTIYCHIHIESGRRYIGLTSQTMEKRWKNHINAARNSKSGRWHFPNAIRKYGKDAFSHQILEVCNSLEEANEAEEAWINSFSTRDIQFGFNIAKGGEHIPHVQRNPWDRPDYREKAVRRWQDPEYRLMIITAMQVANDPTTRQKRIDSLKKYWTSSDSKIRASISNSRQWSLQQREMFRAAASRLGVSMKSSISTTHLWQDPNFRVKVSSAISQALKGKPRPGIRKFTDTHKQCSIHGLVPLNECYSKIRSDGRLSHECRICVRNQQNQRYLRKHK